MSVNKDSEVIGIYKKIPVAATTGRHYENSHATS